IGVVTKLAQDRGHLARLLAVLALRLAQALRFRLAEAELHRRVAVRLARTLLHYRAGSGQNHGHGYELATLGEHLRHPELLADQSEWHVIPGPRVSAYGPREMSP